VTVATLSGMDDVKLGSTLRALRIRRGLTQADVARRARVSRMTVSRLERGEIGRQPFDRTRAVANALGLRLDLRARWPGGDLDRAMNARHAAMHESMATRLQELDGWTWRPEVTTSVYGERGVIDVLAWHASSRSLLIIELKTRLIDPQELISVMDRRRRLGRGISTDLGWDPLTVSSWVVVEENGTNRRRIAAHRRLLRSAFPADGRNMRPWLGRPIGRIDALSFSSDHFEER
jgi:transcriptional regulator with XRE-family HTH domain